MTTRADNVLKHLKTRGPITSIEAIGLYSDTRLADTIWRLKQQGHSIITTMKKGVRGRYATYSLANDFTGV